MDFRRRSGALLAKSGHLEEALTTLEEAMRYKIELGGDTDSVSLNLGDLQLRLGNLELARDHLTRGLRGLQERGFNSDIPLALESLGELAKAENDLSRAATLIAASSSARETMNTPKPVFTWAALESNSTTLRTALGEADFQTAWTAGQALTLEQAVAYALDTSR